MIVGRLARVQLLVLDGELQAVPEQLELLNRQLLHLVCDVAGLDRAGQGPSLDGLGQDHHRGACELDRCAVRRIQLAVVVAPPAEPSQVIVGQVLHDLLEPGVRPEEVLPDVIARFHCVLLELPVQGGVHLVDQHAVVVPGQQVVPFSAPHHLDDVPAGAPEHRLQLLDDLAVAADRPVQALEVAVHHEDQVVQGLPGGQGQRGHGLGLVHLAVADEAPYPLARGVLDAPGLEVAVEPGLVDRVDGGQAHRHRGELPELGHESGVGIGGQAASACLATERVELLPRQPALQEGPGVDTGSRVALEVDQVPPTLGFPAPEEVVESHLVQRGRRGVRGDVAADALVVLVGPGNHGGGVPPDEAADPPLQLLVAGEIGLLLRGDRVDVVA